MKKMMFILFLFNIFILCAQEEFNAKDSIVLSRFPYTQQVVYICRDTMKNVDGRFPSFSPMFLIYPDKPCDKNQAQDLIYELGINEYFHKYTAIVGVVNPLGDKYDNLRDFEAYKDLINKLRVISNLKIIGIGAGATFVNKVVACNADAVAGIMSVNGEVGKKEGTPVPAFIAGNRCRVVAHAYVERNGATIRKNRDGCLYYTNEKEPLLNVVVGSNKLFSLKDMFAEAWKCIFSKNYRFNNYRHTWYTGCSFGQYGPYELEPYIMLDSMGIVRYTVTKDLLGTGTFLWYEYHPKSTIKAPKGSVPLLILLHGNNNDPRTQAETSGFIELCAKENFVVAELEWQGNGYTPMGLDGIEQVVYYLLKTYPQLDASRVYAEGLSAGSATATGLGIRKSHLFAAIGGHSAGLFPNRYSFGFNEEAIVNEAIQKRGWVEMPYFSVVGTSDEVVPFINQDNWKNNTFFHAWKVYQIMNGMEVVEKTDFSKYRIFGIKLEDCCNVSTNKNISMEVGVQYKDSIPLLKIAIVNNYGHWNFKPDAQLMWKFFSMFARDPVTKKLIYKIADK